MSETLGLIAGRGLYPRRVAELARARGFRVAAIGFHAETDPALESVVDELTWLHLGELQKMIDTLRAAGASQAVMAGKILKTHLYGDLTDLRPDERALRLLASLGARNDDAILGAVVDEIVSAGVAFPDQLELLPELFGDAGSVSAAGPSEAQWADIRFAWPVAKQMGGLDIGQSVVVKDLAVIAIEAIEGTDAAIRRAAELAGPGCCVVKVAKPSQDPRFDLPTIGLETVKTLAEARAGVLAFEAGHTVLLGGEALAEAADAAGLVLIGIGPDGPAGAA
ncbi:MAG: UDP-2,3-diacylglucosamine diphosphatase LpxI [Deltaproteobacteria bacterium]|nr:UDP-2,3-diacylglucosamine diphosphatase LpxI [Deltaproteobacteria bacterium]MBW2444764.1 UDP-2,3-diacylglucosamine diphosphatase LpxI [Deltaproteobacteria bacterium]